MVVVGDISEIGKDGDELEVTIDMGEGDTVSGLFYQRSNSSEYPQVGDRVVAVQAGNEWEIVGVYRSVEGLSSGEWIAFSRSGNGSMQASIKLTAGKTVEIDGDVNIKGNLNVTGNIDATGSITAGLDVVAGPTNVSVLSHTHNVTTTVAAAASATETTSGQGTTNPPNPGGP